MKIKKDDSAEIVLEESGVLLYLIGGVVSFAGILLLAQSIYTGEVGTILFSMAVLGIGVLVIFITENTIVTITHATRTIQVRKRRLLSKEANKYQFDVVQSVALITNKLIGHSSEMRMHSQLAIIVDNIPIPLDSMMYTTGRLERERAVGQRLASVLNVPFTDPTQNRIDSIHFQNFSD